MSPGLEATSRFRVAAPPAERPLLIFDGDCNFCRLWVNRWLARTAGRVDYAPSQEMAARFPEIPPKVFARSVIFIDTDGEACCGAQAVFRALALTRAGAWPLWLYHHAPGVAGAAEILYAFVASRRTLFSRITRLVWGQNVMPPSYGVARCLFLRLMAVVYLIAFVSLWVQIDGLIGSRGILPVASWVEAGTRSLSVERYWEYPTLCWLNSSDMFLHLQCGAGALLALAALAGLAPAPCFAILWALYLSLTIACREFLGFQWDNLLLEAGFLSILLSPLVWRCRLACETSPARTPLVLVHWLVFRLMFSSGVVKLSSGDPTWRDLTALTFHYQTQCLPPWTAWYAHHMPVWAHKLSCALMFGVELGAPFLILAPRRLRHLGAGALIGLQLIVMATGNYGFFNLLSIALCLTLLDDTFWPLRWRASTAPGGPVVRRWSRWITVPLAAVIFTVGAVRQGEAFRTEIEWPAPISGLVDLVSPFRSVNWYGLFSIMTTTREEIIVEGSDDGTTWLAYEFKWKPGDATRRPAFVTPHMPRLDWEMWFAALTDYRSAPWFTRFLGRLLEGSPQVLALLDRNPFPNAPPRYVRAVLYDYVFTEPSERRDSGAWWKRRFVRDYAPALSLRR